MTAGQQSAVSFSRLQQFKNVRVSVMQSLTDVILTEEAMRGVSTIVYCWGGETGRRTWGQEGLE